MLSSHGNYVWICLEKLKILKRKGGKVLKLCMFT